MYALKFALLIAIQNVTLVKRSLKLLSILINLWLKDNANDKH